MTTLYTVLGGMKAVLWTDVAQFFVLMGGLVAVLIGVGMAFGWDVAAIWHVAANPGTGPRPWLDDKPDLISHTAAFNFAFNFTDLTFWGMMIWTFLQFVGAYGSDQVLVQRYLAAGSPRKMAVSLVSSGLLLIPVNALLFGTGIFLVAYYSKFIGTPGHEWIGTLKDPNNVMTHYISHGLPGTMGALVVAGLFAGTMSSLSAGLNSLSTATYVDFVTRFGRKQRTEERGVANAKLITLAWGVIIMTCASFMGGGETIFAIIAKVMSPFAGPLLGMFLVGMLTKRATNFGVIFGAVVAVALTFYVTYFTGLHWTWYFVIGSGAGMLGGYLLSLLGPPDPVKPAPDPVKA